MRRGKKISEKMRRQTRGVGSTAPPAPESAAGQAGSRHTTAGS